jgi:glycosyltransferase involved in cell wall biosynthesis
MYKIGVCGHFGNNHNLLNGQTVKTKVLTEELERILGKNNVKIVDTYNWKKNPFSLFINCYTLSKKCKNIVVLPAQGGIKVLIPLFLLLNIIFKKKLHYVVIGGWLPKLLENNKKLKNKIAKFDGVYVETNSMIKSLQSLGLENVIYLPNFKRLKILSEKELIYSTEGPYKLCTFSRVLKEKGIEDAIEIVKEVNEKFKKVVYTLDIYGQVDENYVDRFEQLKKQLPNYISYKGIVNYDDSVNVLKNYFALLFPTYYKGEGFAGTILDGYAAGIPVIATDWQYNSEIINNKKDGLIYNHKKLEQLRKILISIYSDPSIINNMKRNCLNRAYEYLPEVVIKDFIKHLD